MFTNRYLEGPPGLRALEKVGPTVLILDHVWLMVLSGAEPEKNKSWHLSELNVITGDHLIVKGSNVKCSLKYFRPHFTFSF